MPHNNKDILRPLGILPPPVDRVPQRWTAHLIKRDVKEICKTNSANIKKRFYNLLATSSKASINKCTLPSVAESLRARLNGIKTATNPSVSSVFIHKNTAIKIEKKAETGAKSREMAVTKKASKHMRESSVETAETGQPSVFTERIPTGTTCDTELTLHERAPPVPKFNSHYELMGGRLDAWYEQYKEERMNLTHEERFENLGTIKFLRIIVELHPSNPTYIQFRRNALYMNQHESNAVTRRWVTITVGSTDRTATHSAIEAILHEVWPMLDVGEYLTRIGNPGKGFGQREDDELREKLRPLLYPDYEQLFR